MADNVTVDNGGLTDYSVASEELSGGEQLQSVELHTESAGAKTKLAKLEDAAHTSGDAGIQMLTVRKDTAAATSGTDGDYQPPITDASGRLWVNVGTSAAIPVTDNSGSLTVDGTVGVSGTVTVDGSGVTQPVSGTVAVSSVSTSITPGTGAANLGKAEDAAHASGDTGVMALGVRKDTATALAGTDGDYQPSIYDSSGRLHVNAAGVAVPVTDNSGSLTVDNGGTFAVQESGSALTSLQLLDDTVFTDDAAFTVATSKVNAIGLMADQASTDSVNEGDIGIPRMTLDRKQITTVAPSNDTEGLDVFRTLDADETEEDVKTSAGKLYGWFIYNDGAAEVYVKLYNATAANTTVGSTTPRMTIPIPAGSAANVEFTNGITFDTAICIAATTAVGDADTTAPSANQVVANIFYK